MWGRGGSRVNGGNGAAPCGTRFPSPSRCGCSGEGYGERRTASGPFSSSVGWFVASPASDPRGRQTLPASGSASRRERWRANGGVAHLSQRAQRASGRGHGRPAAVGEGLPCSEPPPTAQRHPPTQAMAPPGVGPAWAPEGRRMTRRTVALGRAGPHPSDRARDAGRSADLSRAALRAWERWTANGERRRSLRVPRAGPAFPLLRDAAAQERATASDERLWRAARERPGQRRRRTAPHH